MVKNSDYNVTFILNDRFAPFEDLLGYTASYILPDGDGGVGPYINAIVDIADDFVIGTGPFVFDHYEDVPDGFVNLHAIDDYWRGKANIDELVFSEIRNATARNAALLTGDIHFLRHYLPEMLGIFAYDPDITVLDTGRNSGVIKYIGMNNRLINVTFREAISYAINYSYIIDDIKLGTAVRLKSPLPFGLKYANWTFNAPIYNLTRARLVMQSMGFGVGFDLYSDTEWVNQEANTPFATYNYTYNIGNAYRMNISVLLMANLPKIGIRVTDAGMSLAEFYYKLHKVGPYHRNQLELYCMEWAPDYNDPMNFINPLFTNRSIASNGAQYDGWLAAREARLDPNYTASVNENNLWDNVQLLMEAAIHETNTKTRKQMFWRMQELLVERDYPWVFGYITIEVDAFDSDLKGMITEAMRNPYFYPCYWEDYSMVISSPSDITYEVGDTGHSISWTLTVDPVEDPMYYIYENNSLIDSDIWVSGSPIMRNVDGLSVGVTQYRIEAHNSDEVAEDIVIVTVEPPPTEEEGEEPEIPGYSLIFLIGAAIFALFYMFKRMGKKIK